MKEALQGVTFSLAPSHVWPRPQADQAGRVTVVVRTKDRPLLLRRACETVLAQTHKDWSLIDRFGVDSAS